MPSCQGHFLELAFVGQRLQSLSTTMADYNDDDDDGLWEKPAWAKGGVKLKSTGKADAMKKEGNLAAPITNIRESKDAMKKIKEINQGK